LPKRGAGASKSGAGYPHLFPALRGILNGMEESNSSISSGQDTSRQNLTIEEAAELFSQAGVPRSHRTISRYCEQRILEAVFMDTEKNQKYLITRESVERRIKEIKQILATSHVPSGHDKSGQNETHPDKSRHVEPTGENGPDASSGMEEDLQLPALRTELKKLKEDNLQLHIDKSAKEQFINRLVEEREQTMRRAIELSREVGRLENQLLQLEGPRNPDMSRHMSRSDENRRERLIDPDERLPDEPPEEEGPEAPAEKVAA